MNFNFELIFFYAVVTCGLIVLFDVAFLARRRRGSLAAGTMPIVIEYARSFFPILLIVFFLRSFLYEPFRIPSGSDKPTLLIGDFILVNKFEYGVRLPVFHQKIISMHEPKRGDIVVFREPPSQSRDLIKRVIGLPGDHISYINKVLYINGQQVSQTFEKFGMDQEDHFAPWKVEQKKENLLGIQHEIFHIPTREQKNFYDVQVPAGQYFMMGDNRDDSADSRSWGFLPEENIVGKAVRVLISWDTVKHPIRWSRTWLRVQ